ncbi:transglutaminase family protein [Marinomonas colpomeniae]|uniref:Transglutaminase family protein n=1 Tax=Marinomonas colpomeniae TaxID=2774408 RepID=A0ABR8NUD0_9GAMM|nr:transglutaminase family protein [Marinomonas colpomeniae]MBD5769662.1 transglutaminase family protein [Marinomonas colpomeniae]
MTIRVAIQHKTTYEFDRFVNVAPHVLRLQPAAHSRTKIHDYSLTVLPEKHFINVQQDPFGNFQTRLVFPEKTKKLEFMVEVIADMTVLNPFDFFVESYAEEFPFAYDKALKEELDPYLKVTESCPLLDKWLSTVDRKSTPTNDFLVAINSRLAGDIGYGIRLEPGVQTCEETLTLKKGSCRDTSWLLVQIFRSLGLAARFASGYLVQLTSDVKALDGPSGPEEDFTDLHAWCEVFLPGAGWVGLDPTSGLFAGEGHIPLACTPEPASAAPITGLIDECECEFSYTNIVTRIHEDPRVTKPYAEGEWETIKALGFAVDKQLEEGDVRLTMGGEPTFVSIDDMDSEQWNTGALGAEKLKLAKDLLLKMKQEFGANGLLHYGQGKWYPGEEVPRWALGCFWRTDGEALWDDPKYLARVDKNYKHTIENAAEFGALLCERLNLDKKYLQSTYEDTLHYLWLEQSLPADVDPTKADLKDDLERRRLAKLLNRGLSTTTGYVLPLEFNVDNSTWNSSLWPMRSDVITLIPGDSPMGYRLPLNSLPAEAEEDRIPERDPFDPRQPLANKTSNASLGSLASTVKQTATKKTEPVLAPEKTLKNIIRTSLCIEPRDGRLHVFMPPMTHLEHFVSLLEHMEQVAKSLDLPIVIEGYEPPKDPRLQKFLITPDPGVIEVNIHPASSWKELVHNTETLYHQAYLSRLGAEKFMLDGRHTGTGGGNHVTLGGKTPADSPLLRRPELLQSLVTFWQHHPGLSYLFSGMFIGPTSQAPRPDEGRDEALYEMEIAFQNMPEGFVEEPWLVDRLMRNLLVDITGNTHRSEFCIDKLYAAGSASGRQGLLEFRGFEMPPHPHMSLVQMLLLRCLVARFWKEPYKQPLVRWGTSLHDKFMLPHFVWQDIKEVVEDLQRHGFPFKLEWLAPFEEFRFPHYGRKKIDDMEIELRWAIEPWHVLGEEITGSGTARYVDSSVERLQVKLSGLTDGRYVLSCNGRRVPIRSTGRKGEYVGAVRYKAWAPPSALHPTLGIDAPLVFDLIDSWNGLSVGGCTYHVTHPGGRTYDNVPVNSNEAEARRVNRFWDHGFTQGPLSSASAFSVLTPFYQNEKESHPMSPPAEEPLNEYPHTLDLRKQYNVL